MIERATDSEAADERMLGVTRKLVHNHMTRDIKPQGQCPSCDRHYPRATAPPQEPTSQTQKDAPT